MKTLMMIPADFSTPNITHSDILHSDIYGKISEHLTKGIHDYFCSYVWNESEQCFEQLVGLEKNVSVSSLFADYSHGVQSAKVPTLQQLHGPNKISVRVPSYLTLLVEEVLHPFYMFQVCSITLWMCDDYYYYAACIIIISLISISLSLYETKRQAQSLHDMVSAGGEGETRVVRPGSQPVTMEHTDLVPGDVVLLPAGGCVMPCDAVLITGSAIVNEAMLTGESVPVTKSCVSSLDTDNDELYSPETHKRNTIFAGTEVIQTRYYGDQPVLAVVVRTGFSTSKGELIRSILFPKPMDFKFYRDSIRFICVLFVCALAGMSYCLYLYISRGASLSRILLRTLDVITIVVPPALPAAMTVGTVYAQARLRKQGIFCISPARINVCGKLKLVCFDKTGTLTEEGLDMWGVIPATEATFTQPVRDMKELEQEGPLLGCMATCHSLITIGGQLNGDPLDLKMFLSTGWDLEEPGQDSTKFDKMISSVVKPPTPDNDGPFSIDSLPFEIGITRQFPFSSTLARMSVIVRRLGSKHFTIFTKGAPEKLEELCVKESIPVNYHEQLKELTVNGYRVIGLAVKDLDKKVNWVAIQKMKRTEVECDLTFLGFLIMQNTLKPESEPVIRELSDANIRTVMVTGDNLLTALSVARDCGMVGTVDRVIIAEAVMTQDHWRIVFTDADKTDNSGGDSDDQESTHVSVDTNCHVAITGKTWAVIKDSFPELMSKILIKGTIFSRMSPDQKASLVEELQSLGYIVSMCGDGANDCGALKAAHVGVSLSEAEASVAAPFTSSISNISCIPKLIKEGRCALTTSFGVFKYMALYSFIQFISVLVLYTRNTNLGDTHFLYIDLVITTTVAVLMGRTGPWHTLVTQRPPGSLVSGHNLLSVGLQILVSAGAQLAAVAYLEIQPWNKDPQPNGDDEVVVDYLTSVVFVVSCYQYLSVATVFSKGPPYRRPFYSNSLFTISVVSLATFTAILYLNLIPPMSRFFQLMTPELPTYWRFTFVIFGIIASNTLVNIAIELLLVTGTWVKTFSHFVCQKKQPKNRYKIIQRQLDELPDLFPNNDGS